jgi:uncharacterized protein YndB with AHSA1/START domain/ankyrin repeat protein
MTELGTLRADGERCAVRFERLYDATPDELWSALTEAEQLRGWLAEVTRLQLEPGGAFELRFGDGETERATGTVRTVEAPRLLELDWTFPGEPDSHVRFELEPRDEGVLLILEHRQLSRESGAAYGAGWHAHLDGLEAHLAGGDSAWDERFAAVKPGYDRQAAALGWSGPGGSPLLDAIAAGDDDEARRLARERPGLLSQPDDDGLLPAVRALYIRGHELAAALAPPDEELDATSAAALGRTQRLAALIDEDARRAAATSPDGFTALHLACFAGGAETTRLLIERDAPLETLSANDQVQVRALGTAAFSGDLESARALLEAGADANGAGSGGFVPLHTAAQNGDAELVRLLLEHGARTEAATEDGMSPDQLAHDAGHEEVVALLRGTAAATE